MKADKFLLGVSMQQINEYRCTRRAPYRGDCPGRTMLSARQGHYIRCESKERAEQIMGENFPEDLQHGYGFDIQLWKENISVPQFTYQ